MKLCVEGWRGINHSYAMLHQYQLLELLKRPDVALTTRDLPFYRPEWSPTTSPAGFDAARAQAMANIPPPDGSEDVVYRISYPYRAGAAGKARVFCEATCEYRRMIDAAPFAGPPDPAAQFITTSNWSRDGLAASGLAAERVHVVPLGVDPAIFYPPTSQARAAARARLRIAPERFVFLNVSTMNPNKGIDILLRAFAIVRQRHPEAMLLLKDQRALYGSSGGQVIQETLAAWPQDLAGLSRDAVGVIGKSLGVAEMAELYGACDAYVSPYRAEGFNLPPLEAAACGVPVAVTAGGSTDDYAHDSFALRLPARDHRDGDNGYLDPELDGVVDAMTRMIERRLPPALDAARAVAHIGAHHTWMQTVDKLLAVFKG